MGRAPLRTLLVAAAAGVLVTLGGCGDSPADDTSSTPFDEDLIGREYYQSLSPYQQDILSDGDVTFAEYEQSLLDYRACVEAEGAIFDHFELSDRRIYDYAYGRSHTSPLTQGDVDAIHEACSAEFASAVEPLWQVEFAPENDQT